MRDRVSLIYEQSMWNLFTLSHLLLPPPFFFALSSSFFSPSLPPSPTRPLDGAEGPFRTVDWFAKAHEPNDGWFKIHIYNVRVSVNGPPNLHFNQIMSVYFKARRLEWTMRVAEEKRRREKVCRKQSEKNWKMVTLSLYYLGRPRWTTRSLSFIFLISLKQIWMMRNK